MQTDERDRKGGQVAAVRERDVTRLPARVELALEERQPANVVEAPDQRPGAGEPAFLSDGLRVVEAGQRGKAQ